MTDKEQTMEKGLEIVSNQERDLAFNALNDFKKKSYISCLQNMNKLENVRNNDFKIMHNKAVVEYYKSDLKKSEQFQRHLTTLCYQFKIKIENLEEIDHCLTHFNQAVLMYHQRQYTTAQTIMDRVYKFIEPMDENLAKQVSLLAIEIQLCLHKPDKALTLINYLENNLMYGGSIPFKGLEKSGRDKKIQLPPAKPISEEFQKKLLKYKIRCYLMKHSLPVARKEIARLTIDKQNIDALFMAANLEYLKGNFTDSMNILSSIPIDAYIYSERGESSKILCNNNMGILYHAMGKPNLASFHFQTAFKEDMVVAQNNGKKEDSRPLYTLGGTKYHELMYNLGIALLHSGRPTQAFDCLIIAVRRYHRNSRLWLRLAECCIMVHKESNEVDFDVDKKHKEIIVDILGSKDKQTVVLKSNLSHDKKYCTESQSYAVPVPSLEFASLCLRNANLLIPSDTESPPLPLFLIPGVSPPTPPSSPTLCPSNPPSRDDIILLKNSILIGSAYVSLCLGDYILSLEYSKEVLQQSRISGVHKLLAHLYAAESLVLLDKIADALDYLNPDHVKDISFDLPEDNNKSKIEEDKVKTSPQPKWFPMNVNSAHCVMQYNIAVAKTIRGQLDQAAALLKKVWQLKGTTCNVPAHIIMLVVYIELQLGHVDIARNLIRQYSFQQRLNG